MKVCAVIDCRAKKQKMSDLDREALCKMLNNRLFCEILRMTREHVKLFITELQNDADIIAAEVIIQIKGVMISRGVQLCVIAPTDKEAKALDFIGQERYDRILSKANRIEHIQQGCSNAGLSEENRWMIDNATDVLVVCDKSAAEVNSAIIDYAREKGLEITVIEL